MGHHSERQDLQIYEFDRTKENKYLDRIASLMDTSRRTLNSYAKIKLWEDGPNYQKVVKYVNNSQCHPDIKLSVVNIHRIWVRNGEADNLFHISNRHLLWHGTKRANIPHILNDGFKLPENEGQMFGSGIYFADRITKSSNYSDLDVTFLLLCEVGLGNVYSCKRCHNDWTRPPVGFDSVKANGIYVPDWTESDRYYGAHIPFGRTAKCTKYGSHATNFNEFIVYDPSRIIIRFLVEVKVEKVMVPRPLQLVTPGRNKTTKKPIAVRTTGLSAQTITGTNNLPSHSATSTKPTLSSQPSILAPIQYATANASAGGTKLRSLYSTTSTKPTLSSQPSILAPIQYATTNASAGATNLRSSCSTYAKKPTLATPARDTYAYERSFVYSGNYTNSPSISSIPVHRAQHQKKRNLCCAIL